MQTFLGIQLADAVAIQRVLRASTVRALSSKPIYQERPNQRLGVLAGVVPDAFGADNLAGRIEAHQRKHRTDRAFDEVCPQRLGTLAAGQAARTVRAKTDAGTLTVPASGSVAGVQVGRVVSFGGSTRLYEVVAVSTATNTLEIDIPLAADLARGASIDFSPTGSWHWSDPPEPPQFSGGALAGVGWLLDVVEAVA